MAMAVQHYIEDMKPKTPESMCVCVCLCVCVWVCLPCSLFFLRSTLLEDVKPKTRKYVCFVFVLLCLFAYVCFSLFSLFCLISFSFFFPLAILDTEIVCILCLDNRMFVRCDSTGSVFADKDKEICKNKK
jgi:hypothetical protein